MEKDRKAGYYRDRDRHRSALGNSFGVEKKNFQFLSINKFDFGFLRTQMLSLLDHRHCQHHHQK